MPAQKPVQIEYMCRWCGNRVRMSANAGRPLPGTCSRRPRRKDGSGYPHTWVINRKIY